MIRPTRVAAGTAGAALVVWLTVRVVTTISSLFGGPAGAPMVEEVLPSPCIALLGSCASAPATEYPAGALANLAVDAALVLPLALALGPRRAVLVTLAGSALAGIVWWLWSLSAAGVPPRPAVWAVAVGVSYALAGIAWLRERWLW